MADTKIKASMGSDELVGLDASAEKRFVDLFDNAIVPEASGYGGAWLYDLRRAAMDRFVAFGLPHRKIEEWKYTDIRPRLKKPFVLPTTAPDALPRHAWTDGTAGKTHRLVFVDGLFKPGLSDIAALPPEIELVPLTALPSEPQRWARYYFNRTLPLERRPLLDLNTAMMRAGLLIRVAEGAKLVKPLEIVFHGATGGVQAHVRNLLVVEDGAEVTLIESYVGAAKDAYFMNSALEIVACAESRVRHYKMQSEAAEALHIATVGVKLDRNAFYDGFYLAEGAGLARHDGSYVLAGDGAQLRVNGAYMLADRQHSDVTTVIEHRVPKCTSREVFHGVLSGRSKGVFQGRIHVDRQAQGTDGYQLSKTLLLSDKAEVDTKPELEIFADDVKCSHGATAGALDEQAIFYLRSRGLPLPQAKGLLIAAFLDQVVDTIDDVTWRVPLQASIAGWLDRNAAAGLELPS